LEDTFSVLFVILELARVTGTVRPDLVSLAVSAVIIKVTGVLASVRPGKLTCSFGLIVDELADIGGS